MWLEGFKTQVGFAFFYLPQSFWFRVNYIATAAVTGSHTKSSEPGREFILYRFWR